MTIAKTRPKFRICSGLITLTILSIPQLIKAQTTFTYADTNGYVLAGFRNGGAQEFVANLGKIEAFQALGPGVTTNLGSYTPAQLSEAFSDYNNLNWSVFSTFNNSTFSPLGSMPFGTAWWTVPRTDLNTQTTPPARFSIATMSGIRNQILSFGNDAVVSCSHP